ncbi:hypothetical protein HM131_10125 [Halobacillus mangrovi]|uniref:Uncharacterized protein n=1 Tax=Halobacillus mangrovi TaxID=402384 RepID=A0A1W5ZV88_9BACI|nr:hypothetical protein HM131_10125 [Halobacillus mangrovi]
MENSETPAGEELRRDPTLSAAKEEARQFPRRKASCFPANLTLITQRPLHISKLSLQDNEAYLLERVNPCRDQRKVHADLAGAF